MELAIFEELDELELVVLVIFEELDELELVVFVELAIFEEFDWLLFTLELLRAQHLSVVH